MCYCKKTHLADADEVACLAAERDALQIKNGRYQRALRDIASWPRPITDDEPCVDTLIDKAQAALRDADPKCAMCREGKALGSGLCEACAERISHSHDPRTCDRCKQEKAESGWMRERES